MQELPRFIVDERNNSSTRRFNKLGIRGCNVGNIGIVVEAARGAVSGMTKDSDNGSGIETAAGDSWCGGGGEVLAKRYEEGNPAVVEHVGVGVGRWGVRGSHGRWR